MTSGQLMMDQGQDVGESARIRTMILFTRSTPLTMYDRTPSTSCRFSAPVACTSGSVIIGKSIRLSIGRPLRVWQGHLVFGLDLLPGRVCRYVNAEQAKARERGVDGLLVFRLYDIELDLQVYTAAWSTFEAPRCSNSTVSCSAFSMGSVRVAKGEETALHRLLMPKRKVMNLGSANTQQNSKSFVTGCLECECNALSKRILLRKLLSAVGGVAPGASRGVLM
jgi:hypothetical protein